MPERLSYWERPISLAALSVIELTPPQMVTAVSLAGYRYISRRLLPVTPHEPRYDILGDRPMRRDLQHRLDDSNVGILTDSLHFAGPGRRLPRSQPCPSHRARAERQFPGEGGLDLMGLLRALPRDIPIGIETPTRALALNVGPVERARRALEATGKLLQRLDDDDHAAAGTWPQTRSGVEDGICCPNSGDASSAPLL
jgi:hypothetical protein